MSFDTHQKTLRITTKALFAAFVFIGLSFNFANAQQNDTTDWWFDVEVLIFKYNSAPEEVQEQFASNLKIDVAQSNSSLFFDQLLPNLRWLYLALPVCDTETFQGLIHCRPETLPFKPISIPAISLEDIHRVPIIIDGVIIPYPETIHFLPAAERELIELYKNIRWDKTTTPLLHSVWRQPVMVGEENATPLRIVAGTNLTYVTPDIIPISEDNTEIEETAINTLQNIDHDLPSQIRANLTAPDTVIYSDQIEPITEVEYTQAQFELDGIFNVFIRYVNGVPYLHIDAHLGFYTLENGLLLPHEFKQRRRIISQQVHYFDHPYFGMIVELRRYKRPVKEVSIEHEDLY